MKPIQSWLLIVIIMIFLTPVALARDTEKYRELTNWEYHFGELPQTGTVSWQGTGFSPSLKVPPHVVTIWFKTRLNGIRWENSAVYYQSIFGQTLDIFIDHQKVATKRHRSYYNVNKFIAPLGRNFNDRILYIRISNSSRVGNNFGQVPKVFIGDFNVLLNKFMLDNLSDIICGCFLILLGIALVMGSLFLHVEPRKSWSTLGFILIFNGIGWAIFPMNIGTFFPQFEEQVLLLIIIVLLSLAVLLGYFFEQIFGPGRKAFIRRLWQIQLVVSVCCLGISIANILSGYRLNPLDYFFTHDFLGVLYMFLFGILVVVAIRFAYKGNTDAKILTMGFSAFALFTILDLILFFATDRDFNFFKYGLVFFLAALFWILVRRVAANYQQVFLYSKELELKNQELDAIWKEVQQSRDQLLDLNKTLEQRVAERTEQLSKANENLTMMNEELSTSNENLLSTLDMLTKTQNQLIESEKMAALGQLVAGVAHEINSPLGAIGASIENILELFKETLEKLVPFYQSLPEESLAELNSLLETSLHNNPEYISSSEERNYRRAWLAYLQTKNLPDPEKYADMLVSMGIYNLETSPAQFGCEENIQILEMAYKISGLKRNAQTIKMAVERTTKVVFALKSYAHFGSANELLKVDIRTGMEMVLTLYHNKTKHGVEVVRDYKDIPLIRCYPDELNQIWTNIIHNALQAMDYQGKLTIGISQTGNYVVVSITDTGTGIPGLIKDKIFDPFFTTKPQGEGSGLGLQIVKQIIAKHQGKIEVDSQPGWTTFRVFIPNNL